MPDVPREQRINLLDKAVSAATAGLAELERLSNSSNPTVAADATERLIAARNARDDLAVTRAFLDNPANGLKEISEADLAQLNALENSIDARIRDNQLIDAGLSAAANIIRTAQSVGQILREA
jgi:hypothetical protein